MWDNIKFCFTVIGYCILVFGTILTIGAFLAFAFEYVKTYLEGLILGVASIGIAGLIVYLSREK